MFVNNRQCVEHLTAICFRKIDKSNTDVGHGSATVGPFDDLGLSVSAAMLEAALDSQRPVKDWELLPDGGPSWS